MNCDPQHLATQAACFQSCISGAGYPAVANYLLCKIANASLGSLIPPGSLYSGPLAEFDLVVSPQTNYLITWGSNDLSVTICGVSYPSTGAGTSTAVNTAACALMQFFGTFTGTTVTAKVKVDPTQIPIPTGFTWIPDGSAHAIASWDTPPTLSGVVITGTQVWTSTDNITFALATTIGTGGPQNTGTAIAAPAAGTVLYCKIRWCQSVVCGGFTSVKAVYGTVSDFGTRVVTNGGATVSNSTMTALNTLFDTLTSNSLITNCLTLNPFIPDSLTGCLTPLIKVKGNDPYTNFGYVLADLSASGLKGSGTKHLDSGLLPIDVTGGKEVRGTIAIYTNTASNGAGTAIDAGTCNADFSSGTFVRGNSGNAIEIDWPPSGAPSGVITDAIANYAGYVCASRSTGTLLTLYIGNSTTAHQSGGTNVNDVSARNSSAFTFFIGGANQIGGLAFPSANRINFFIGFNVGLTSAQSLALFNAIQAYRTTVGGAV